MAEPRPPLPPFSFESATPPRKSAPSEQWEFNKQGIMRRRETSINDVLIKEEDRKFRWPLGKRPADHPGLTELGL